MKIAIYGAGAIGRGILSGVLMENGFTVGLVDKDRYLVEKLRHEGEFPVITVRGSNVSESRIKVHDYLTLEDAPEFVSYADAIMICVGVDSYIEVLRSLSSDSPVICCENDIRLVEQTRKLHSRSNVGFMVSDVIAYSEDSDSESIPAIVVDPGRIFMWNNFGFEVEGIEKCDDISQYWNKKFFLHNTPHAIIGYVGKTVGLGDVPSAMGNPEIKSIICDALENLTKAVIEKGLIDEQIAATYAKNEINRWENPVLKDPLSRITRSAKRKLGGCERFFAPLELINSVGGNGLSVALGAACCAMDVIKKEGRIESASQICGNLIEKLSGLPSHSQVCRSVITLSENLADGASPISLWKEKKQSVI